MRRKMLKALSLLLGGLVSTNASAQDHDPRAVEYGVPPMNEPVPEIEPDPLPVPVYGIPAIEMVRVRGRVVRAKNGKPLGGVQVSFAGARQLTDDNGEFIVDASFPEGALDTPQTLVFEDIDGRKNRGRFLGKTVELDLGPSGLSPIPETGLVVELERQ